MLDIDQYITLFIQVKTEELEEFKKYIKTSKLPKRKTSYAEWETVYLNWAMKQEDNIEKNNKMHEIYLNVD